MKRIACRLLAAFCFTLTASLSYAQWIQTAGPAGVDIGAMASHNGTLFLTTRGGGVFSSPDNGASWELACAGTEEQSFYCLACVDTVLVAGHSLGGVFCSSDNGRSWHDITSNLTRKWEVSCLASCGTVVFAAIANRIYHTSDLGSSWDTVHAGLSDVKIYETFGGITVSGSTVFALNVERGAYRSTDSGDTWRQSAGAVPDLTIRDLAVCGGKLFAAADNGVFSSDDHGTNWHEAGAGLPTKGVPKLIEAESGLYALYSDSLLYYREDSSTAWRNTGVLPLRGSGLFASGAQLYFHQSGSFFRSADNGSTWTEEDHKFIATDIYRFGGNGSTIVAATVLTPRVFRSSDKGATWIPLSTERVNGEVNCVAFSGPNLLAGGTSLDGGIDLSKNMGGSWRRVTPGKEAQIEVMAVMEPYVFAVGEGIWISRDHGETWERRNDGLPGAARKYFSMIAVLDTSIVMAESGGDTLYVTNDKGTNWTRMPARADMAITTLCVQGRVLFAGTYGQGIFRSADRGMTWGVFNAGLTDSVITDITAYKGTLFASTKDHGVFASSGSQAEWREINAGLKSLHIPNLFVQGEDLYAGTLCYGVWRRPLSEIAQVDRSSAEAPDVFALEQNYPNPFNPSTLIRYRLPRSGMATLKVFNILGQEVRELVHQEQQPGVYSVAFDAHGLASGMYLYRLETGTFTSVRKLVLVK